MANHHLGHDVKPTHYMGVTKLWAHNLNASMRPINYGSA